MYAAYEPSRYAFEIFELFRKLLLTSVLIFVAPGTAAQLVVALLVCFISLVINVRLQPFVRQRDDDLQMFAQIQLFLILLSGLLLKVEITSMLACKDSGACVPLASCVAVANAITF